jgi:hypothetical protein
MDNIRSVQIRQPARGQHERARAGQGRHLRSIGFAVAGTRRLVDNDHTR